MKTNLNELGSKKTIVWLILTGAGIVAFWLATRVALLFSYNYIFNPDYLYNQYEILTIVAYALTVNLVFTLLDSLYKPEQESLRFIFSATIQAVLIGVIVLLPKYGDPTTINRLGGSGFAFLLISMSILLAVLVIARNRLNR